MARAKSVKPEEKAVPEAQPQQITIDKAEFVRTRDAVSYLTPRSRRIRTARALAIHMHHLSRCKCVGASSCLAIDASHSACFAASRRDKQKINLS